jgi:penicillin-binding protein 2
VSYHPNDVARRATVARGLLVVGFLALASAFFRAQVLRTAEYLAQAEQNRFREVPLAAPRGIIYDRNGRIIAENLPGYAVSLLSPTADSLRSAIRRLANVIPITDEQVEAARRHSAGRTVRRGGGAGGAPGREPEPDHPEHAEAILP